MIIQSKYFPIYLINLFGVIFVRKSALNERIVLYFPEYIGTKLSQEDLRYIIGVETLNEEDIHTEQMKWLLFLPYYLLYIIFFIIYFIKTMNFNRAYELNPFEREAKENRMFGNYCDVRKKFGWIRYF